MASTVHSRTLHAFDNTRRKTIGASLSDCSMRITEPNAITLYIVPIASTCTLDTLRASNYCTAELTSCATRCTGRNMRHPSFFTLPPPFCPPCQHYRASVNRQQGMAFRENRPEVKRLKFRTYYEGEANISKSTIELLI